MQILLLLEEARLLGVRLREREDEAARACGLTRASAGMLEAAKGGADSVARLARKLGQSRQGVQRVADDLVESGLATYESNPNHRRSPLLRLNERGRSALRTLQREAASRTPEVDQDLEPEDLDTALHVLRVLRDAL